ncbi:MAG TPA: T9SS type A sorting domain-containing protein [Prolixibacteraceae bacterium]|nr:T9SS type A sorting domain-containing protein [Prolixibacteraceae bacterium]
MKKSIIPFFALGLGMLICSGDPLMGQNNTNCFLEDFEPRVASIPRSEVASEPTDVPTETITLLGDTLGKISNYYFGNAIAAWMGNVTNNETFVKNTQTLAPSLIRFPGGSWSNFFFWNGKPNDIPDSIYDGITKKKAKLYPISGKNDWSTTVDNYYILRQETGSQGLITVNYGYARYGLSSQPAVQAAHLAADWVRYDNGRTKFWEIGNENGGPWEAGWMIDNTTNIDGQPQIITGQLYGQHFRIFADSMRAAAAEIGAKIYIGGQVIHYDGTTSWNSVDKAWNSGFFSEVGDAADFYVMHNYFGSTSSVDHLLSIAQTEPGKNIGFIRQDITKKSASSKPVALTEYNMTGDFGLPNTSFINGMQEVILFNELIKNNFGLAARWLLATGETGMFYQGSDNNLLWQARPEFYYAYYQRLFTGDHAISVSSSNTKILAYASKFASGETGVIIVNRGTTTKEVSINSTKVGFGNQYYVYSLTGGEDSTVFSQYVSVNGVSASGTEWGPREELESIPAKAYPVDGNIFIKCPALSVQFVMVDSGKNIVNPAITDANQLKTGAIISCYPNPVRKTATIEFQTSSTSLINLSVYNQMGEKIVTLVDEVLPSGTHTVVFDRRTIPNGIYFYTLQGGKSTTTKKMVIVE